MLQGAARLMLERKEELARIATLEQGKPLAETRIEVLMNVGLFNFYAGEVFRLFTSPLPLQICSGQPSGSFTQKLSNPLPS